MDYKHEDEYLDQLDEANEIFDIDTKVFVEFDSKLNRDKRKIKSKNKQIINKVSIENKE